MKNLLRNLFFIVLLNTCYGCAMHQGYINNSVALDSNNFNYIKDNISGSASATYIFGIGGLGREAIVDEAKRDMMESHSLRSNQGLANISISWKNTWLIVYGKTTCTVTADVVEFNK